MHEDDILTGTPLEDACLTLEELARFAAVDPQWIAQRVESGLLSVAAGAGTVSWRFTGLALLRVRRMRALERDFDATPELAALVADLLEELDRRRGSRP